MPFTETNGKLLYYTWNSTDRSQKGSGLTLLLIHGLGSSSSFYAPIVPYLTAAGFSCLAVDTHGKRSAIQDFVERYLETLLQSLIRGYRKLSVEIQWRKAEHWNYRARCAISPIDTRYLTQPCYRGWSLDGRPSCKRSGHQEQTCGSSPHRTRRPQPTCSRSIFKTH